MCVYVFVCLGDTEAVIHLLFVYPGERGGTGAGPAPPLTVSDATNPLKTRVANSLHLCQ